jgi:hypothetical protein
MSLNFLEETKKVNLPQKETNLEGLTAQQLIDKINAFYQRFDRLSNLGDDAEGYFLQLLASYPVSMCSYGMTEQLKLIIALIYLDSKPTESELTKENDPWEGYSYEDLSLVFDRSKASIHEAIKQKETEAKEILLNAKLKSVVRAAALKELIEEEKQKIRTANEETPE